MKERDINNTIRRMHKYKRWTTNIKKRDNKCVFCGKINELEVHHIRALSGLINYLNIDSRDKALGCDQLWDLKNGILVCHNCHLQIEKDIKIKNNCKIIEKAY